MKRLHIAVLALSFGLAGVVVGSLTKPTPTAPAPIQKDEQEHDELLTLRATARALGRDLAACRGLVLLDRSRLEGANHVDVRAAEDKAPEANDEAEPTVIPLRRDYLDDQISAAAVDPAWQAEVADAVKEALSEWPDARALDTHCTNRLCRIEFTTGWDGSNVEKVMDRLNNMPEIQGERMIQVDDSTSPPFAVAYFGRDGAISLNGAGDEPATDGE